MFIERMKQLRKESGLTQSELGKKINVSKAAVSGYETGIRNPDLETLQRIANTFNVSTDYLLGRTEDPNIKIEEKTYNSIDDIVKDRDMHQWLFDLIEKNPESLERIKKLSEVLQEEHKKEQ
ncbi:transcriptional regulator [Listeria grandensis FSL F6-0971]|uniref:Transcriptional regulator n=1 Tax=Listeria grandensis FSL F6-0971 TaxID=1265819 RepID=W7BIW8_9LIST|nr:helix-turn-helix transcriptional regulator [Listeria grandensis]EUJ24720.1 transcriptional regulator [Listeria grandensis FSL F6-0971]